jgi:hypothetical protein
MPLLQTLLYWRTTNLCCKPTVSFLEGDFTIFRPQGGEEHCHNHGIPPSPLRPRSIQILTDHLCFVLDVRRRQRKGPTAEACGSTYTLSVAETLAKLTPAVAGALQATSSIDSIHRMPSSSHSYRLVRPRPPTLGLVIPPNRVTTCSTSYR